MILWFIIIVLIFWFDIFYKNNKLRTISILTYVNVHFCSKTYVIIYIATLLIIIIIIIIFIIWFLKTN